MLGRPWCLLLLLVAPAAGDLADAPRPVGFEAGPDLLALQEVGWAAFRHEGPDVAIHTDVPLGVHLLADDILRVRSTQGFSVEVHEPARGSDGQVFRLRFWSGEAPPIADSDPQVCAVADLVAGWSAGRCPPEARVQMELALVAGEGRMGRAAWRTTDPLGPEPPLAQ